MRQLSADDDSQDIALNIFCGDSIPFTLWSAFNSLCSVVMLALINYMRKKECLRRTIYLDIVILLTIAQFLYDFNYMLSCFKSKLCTEKNAKVRITFDYFVGSLCNTYSLSIVATVWFMVYTKKVPDVSYTRTMYAINIIIAIGILIATSIEIWNGTPEGIKASLDIYNYSRWVGTLICLVILAALSYYIFSSNKGGKGSNPLAVLVRRLVLYPLAQIACRSGEFYTVVTHGASQTKAQAVASQNADSFTAPCGGVLGFITFLIMNEGAYSNLKEMICSCFFKTSTDEESTDDNVQKQSDEEDGSSKPGIHGRKSKRRSVGPTIKDSTERRSRFTENSEIDLDIILEYDEQGLTEEYLSSVYDEEKSVGGEVAENPIRPSTPDYELPVINNISDS